MLVTRIYITQYGNFIQVIDLESIMTESSRVGYFKCCIDIHHSSIGFIGLVVSRLHAIYTQVKYD